MPDQASTTTLAQATPGTPDGRSHAIRQEAAAWAQRTGRPVRALCGVRYVPARLADLDDPRCEACDALLAQLGAT